MKGSYFPSRHYGTSTGREITLEGLVFLRDAINIKYGTRYRIEVQGADAEPGTMPPVYILLHGDDAIVRSPLKYVLWDTLATIDRNGGKP